MAKISELLAAEAIILELDAKEKLGVINELVKPLVESGAITNPEEFFAAIVRRENLESTGIGLGVAIPHARTTAVARIVLAFGRSEEGVDFSSLDGKLSHLVFLIAAPEQQKTDYIVTLARLSKLLRREDVRAALNKAESPEEVVRVIRENE
ncbi:MAG: PTS sugar transporter subunit IIA [bacterium]|jgi:PTS system fructose-specific IIC component